MLAAPFPQHASSHAPACSLPVLLNRALAACRGGATKLLSSRAACSAPAAAAPLPDGGRALGMLKLLLLLLQPLPPAAAGACHSQKKP
jgi:hypothetical protein